MLETGDKGHRAWKLRSKQVPTLNGNVTINAKLGHVIQSSGRLLLYLRLPVLGSEINDPGSNLSTIN